MTIPARIVLDEPSTLLINLEGGGLLYANVDNVPPDVMRAMTSTETSPLTLVLGVDDALEGIIFKRALIDNTEYWLSQSRQFGGDIRHRQTSLRGTAFEGPIQARYC